MNKYELHDLDKYWSGRVVWVDGPNMYGHIKSFEAKPNGDLKLRVSMCTGETITCDPADIIVYEGADE
jgi:hypothetical protein